MKKFILGGLAAAAVIAPIALTAGSANAAVSVNQGVGTVGKDDVKGLFGGNDTDFQNYAPSVRFTATHSESIDNEIQCGTYAFVGGKFTIVKTGTFHEINTTPVTRTVNATTTLGGKKINGWNLTGYGTTTYGEVTSEVVGACPDGSDDIGTASQSPTVTPSVLKVTKGTETFELPNTQVVAAPAA
jgi:hypothetical protein